MNTFVKVNGTNYPALIEGRITDIQWDNRESKAITLTAAYAETAALFKDGISWSIVEEVTEEVIDDNKVETQQIVTHEYDNSEFSVLGDIEVHTDGTCTIYMGKPTDLENAYEKLYGGVS